MAATTTGDRSPCGWPVAASDQGLTHGVTDDFSYNITENPVHVHQLNATLLNCLGIDHHRLTFKHQGLDMRLTGVDQREAIQEILL